MWSKLGAKARISPLGEEEVNTGTFFPKKSKGTVPRESNDIGGLLGSKCGPRIVFKMFRTPCSVRSFFDNLTYRCKINFPIFCLLGTGHPAI